jgi:hypothetical protein
LSKNTHTLRIYCDTEYTIDNKEYKIGNLSDTQLYVANKILSTIKEPTRKQQNQINAIRFIIDYRRDWIHTTMIEQSINRRLGKRAGKTADIITDWIYKVCNYSVPKDNLKLQKA